jgi:hypothetical protein
MVRKSGKAGFRHLGSGASPCRGKDWVAGALARDLVESDENDRLAARTGGELGSFPGAGQEFLLVRGFGDLRAVLYSRIPRMTARSGVPAARSGQRVVGFTVRGNEFGG